MQEINVIEELKELISNREEACLFNPENLEMFKKYVEFVEKYSESEQEMRLHLKMSVCDLLSIKENYHNDFEIKYEKENPIRTLIMKAINNCSFDNLLNIQVARETYELWNTKANKWKAIIERTEKCVKEEKISIIRPFVAISLEATNKYYKFLKKLQLEEFAVLIIVNNTSFIKLIITPDQIVIREERSLRKDIKDMALIGETNLVISFHGVQESEILILSSYKEAKDIQQTILKLRETPRVSRQNY